MDIPSVEEAFESDEAFGRLVDAIGSQAFNKMAEKVVSESFDTKVEQGQDGDWRAVLMHNCGEPECGLSKRTAYIFDTKEEAEAYSKEMLNETSKWVATQARGEYIEAIR